MFRMSEVWRRFGLLPLLLAVCISGCVFMQPADAVKAYERKIIDWQERIKKEGWSENLVGDVASECCTLAAFRYEKGDYWMTPGEFKKAGFKGDCEDIAVFQMGTLKKLGYPYHVRIRVVSTLSGDHAICRVELPDGKWKNYESVRMPLYQFDALFYRTLFDFDENGVYLKE